MAERGEGQWRVQMGRVGAVLFGAASLVTVAGLILPHQRVDELGLAAVAITGAAAAAVMWFGRGRLPEWAYVAFCCFGTLTVTLSIIFNGERLGGDPGGDEMFYLWVALYAAYFFGWAVTWTQIGLVAIGFAVALLVIQPGQTGVSRWLSTVTLVAGAAIVVQLLSRRIEALLGELRAAARTDHLTGLMNRRAFEEGLVGEMARVRRGGPPFALILADLDAFKEINDRLGHAKGDEVLCAAAEELRVAARTGDLVARFGGDEFALLLPDTDFAGASDLARRLAEALAERRMPGDATVSACAGAACYGADGVTMDELVSVADARLYEAKRARVPRSAMPGQAPAPRSAPAST